MRHIAPVIIDTITLQAPAKLNLTLDVLKRRMDGYHEMDMLMVGVSLYDTIQITPSPDIEIHYIGMPPPEGDTVRLAIQAYMAQSESRLGAKVLVHKSIPIEAGLGGGSTDAAATLLGLQQIYQALSAADLHKAAKSVGADVPFCTYNLPARVQGIGDKIIPIVTPEQPLWFLIVKPEGGMSTKQVFEELAQPLQHPDTDAAQAALEKGDLAALGTLLKNVMQPVANAHIPEIDKLCAKLTQLGALGAAMSGSGSAVFGLFEDEKAALLAQDAFPDTLFTAVCSSLL